MSRRSFLKQSLAVMLSLNLPRASEMEIFPWQLAQGNETRYDLILNEVGSNRLDVLQAVREINGASLKTALDILARPGSPVLRGWSRSSAVAVSRRLEGLGAIAEVVESPFLLWVEDVFEVRNRGIVVAGTVSRGFVRINDTVELVGLRSQTRRATVTGIEWRRRSIQYAKTGDSVGLLLGGVFRSQVERGMAVVRPGSISPQDNFPAEIYVLRREEGGNHRAIFPGFKSQFRNQVFDITGTVELPDHIDMLVPGDSLRVTIELNTPCAHEPGMWLEMYDGKNIMGICYLLAEPPGWRLLP